MDYPQPTGCTLTRRGYGVPLSSSSDVIDMLRDALTVTPRPSIACSEPHAFPVFLESCRMIYIPRAFGVKRFGMPRTVELSRGSAAPALTRFVGELRETQLDPVDACMKAIDDPEVRGGIVSLPCGAGKTIIALNVISRVGRRTLIVAAKDFLLNQWKERIEGFLPGASVGFLRGKVCDVIGRDIVLVSLQSLSMKTYAQDLLEDFDMCVFDECHHLGAEVFSRALSKVSTPVCLGLSATLDRKDGLRKVFEWHLGPVIYQAPRDSRSDVLVNVIGLSVAQMQGTAYGAEHYMYGGRLNLARMLTDVCAHQERTDIILDALLKCVSSEQGRKVLILTDRRAHVQKLSTGLVSRGVKESHIGYYLGGMKPECLKLSEACDFIIGTFCMAAEGFDVPSLDTLLLASPVSSIEQAIGRIGRSMSPTYQPVVFDVVDNFSVFKAQAQKRKQFYVSRGYTISNLELEGCCRDG